MNDTLKRIAGAIFAVALSLALSYVLAGCASSYPERFRSYKCGIRVIVASPDQVNSHCRKIVKKLDDGTSVNDGSRFKACIGKKFHGLRTVFLIEGLERSLLHELCHNDGLTHEECDGIH